MLSLHAHQHDIAQPVHHNDGWRGEGGSTTEISLFLFGYTRQTHTCDTYVVIDVTNMCLVIYQFRHMFPPSAVTLWQPWTIVISCLTDVR